MPFFSTDSIMFHYLDVGQGLPFVFQHGLGGDVHQTQKLFVPPLPFRLLTLDCRGHGETRPVGELASLSFTSFADDLVTLLDTLHLERVVVGGISMGAGVALNFTLRYPQRVRGLVLARPAWLYEPLPANLQVYPRIAALIQHGGAAQASERFKHTQEYLELQRTFPEAAVSLLKQFAHPRAEETVAILERLPRDTPTRNQEDWTHIHVPTLVLANEHDLIHPFHYGEILASTIPGATLERITPKGIDAHQHAEDIQYAIEHFLRSVSES